MELTFCFSQVSLLIRLFDLGPDFFEAMHLLMIWWLSLEKIRP